MFLFLFLPSSSVYVAQLILGVGPALVSLQEVTSVRKMDSPSPNSYQMLIVSQLVVGLHIPISSSMLGFFFSWLELVHTVIIAMKSGSLAYHIF